MTVVLAVRDGSVVLMAADCAGVDDAGLVQTRRDSKLCKLFIPCQRQAVEMVIGFQGSWSIGQTVSRFHPPIWHSGTAFEYLVTSWIPALRRWRAREFGEDEKRTPLEGCTLLVAFDAQIFKIYEDGQVAQATTDFDALGEVALGALAAGWALGKRSWDLLDLASTIAFEYTSTVRKPFQTEVCFRS